MLASITSTIGSNSEQINYFSDCGVPELAIQSVSHREIVTPYSTMNLFLADLPSATVWYHSMISGPAGQTPTGSIEALLIDGT